MISVLRFICLVYASTMFMSSSYSNDSASGESEIVLTKAQEKGCVGCHGIDGNLSITPDTPMLGGQAADYIAEALRQYRSGGRNHPIMSAMAAALSESDITELSKYFANQEGRLSSKY